MSVDCEQLAEMVESIPLIESCDRIKSGALRVSTPFRYPNGEHVDVFLEANQGLLPDNFYFSDFGQTVAYLKDSQVLLDSTARRRELVGDILDGSQVRFDGAVFTIHPKIGNRDEVSRCIFALSQICVRISDLVTHQRLRSTNPFRDDVEDFFEARTLSYQSDVKLPPVFGKREIKMDFEVKSAGVISYVNVLAAMNDASAVRAAHDIFIKFNDLRTSGLASNYKLVTVYNSASNAIRTEDIERLETISSAVSYPQEAETLASILVAA